MPQPVDRRLFSGVNLVVPNLLRRAAAEHWVTPGGLECISGGFTWGGQECKRVSGLSLGEMVEVPASPVRKLPHHRLACSETTSGRLVQVLQDLLLTPIRPKNTPETVSHPRSRTNWLAKIVDLAALAQWLLSPFPQPTSHDASRSGFSKGSYP